MFAFGLAFQLTVAVGSVQYAGYVPNHLTSIGAQVNFIPEADDLPD